MAADANLTVRISGQDNLSGELKKIESGVIRFVGAVSAALTTLSAVGFPIVSAANFQKELLNAAKTTNFTRDEVDALRAGLDGLSKQSNITAVDLAKIATLGGQLGIGDSGNVEALIEFTKQIGIAISALDIPAEEAVDSIGKLINIFNVPASEYKNLISSLNEVSNSSTATATQLFDVVRRIGNLGGSVTLPQAAALSASMIDLGLTAETAGTTITKIFADMKSNAAEFANVAIPAFSDVSSGTQKMRYTTEEWVQLVERDGLTALKAYVNGLNQLGTAQSAQVKSQLTGEGRLFEAVTKLQQQQLRQSVIQNELAEAERSLSALKRQGTQATEEQVRAEEARVNALRSASTQANVLDRLNERAQEAFRSGDSALKEQQTTLAGLSAQWQRFTNNITSLFNTIGGTFLGPLTDGLRSLSDSLAASGVNEQLRAAAQNFVDVARRIGDLVAFIRSFTAGVTIVDWGALLNIAGLLIAVAALKGLVGLFKLMGASALSSIPGLTTLQSKLFGVSVAAQKAAADQAKLAAENTRQGGWLQQGSAALTKMIDNYLNLTKSLTDTRDKAARVAQRAQANLSQSQSALATSLSGLPGRYNTVALAVQRVADLEQRRDAANATGNRRSAGGYQSQITQLNRVLAAVQQNEQAVRRYTNSLNLANRVQANAASRLSAISLPFTPQLGQIAASARNAATEFRNAFGAALVGGGNPLTAFLTGLTAAARSAGAAGTAAGASFAAGFRAAILGALSGVGTSLLAALGLENFAARWERSTTATAKAVTLLSGAFSLLGTVARGAFALVSRFVGVAFFALMFKDILQLLGLWDKFLAVLRKGVDFYNVAATKFGLPTIEVPDFIKPAEDLERVAAAGEKVVASMETARAEAAKFGKEQLANVQLLRANSNVLNTDLKFNIEDPGNSSKKTLEYIDALTSGYSRAEVAAAALASTEQQLEVAQSKSSIAAFKLSQAQKNNADLLRQVADAGKELERLKGIPGSTPESIRAAENALRSLQDRTRLGLGPFERDATETAGKVTELQQRVELFSKQLAQLGGLGGDNFAGLNEGARNLATRLFSAEEATRLFTAAAGQSASPIQTLVVALTAQAQASDALAEADRKVKDQIGSKVDATAAVAAAVAQEAAKQKYDQTKEAVAKVRDEVVKLGQSSELIGQLIDRASDTKNLNATVQLFGALGKAVNELKPEQFKNTVLPKVDANSLLSSATTVAVKTRLKDMYDSWASAANIAAERAKNAATTALGDVERLIRSAQESAAKITQAYQSSQVKARRQLDDRADDAISRQRVRDIQTQYDLERSLLEQQFSAQRSYFAEQEAGGVRIGAQKQNAYALEQQALFQLEERFNRLREVEQDRLNIQKAKRGVQDEIKQFDDLIKKIDYYKKLVESTNRVIADPSASLADRAGAIERRNVGLEKMRALYGQLEASGERIANTEPIGGEILVSQAQIAKVNTALNEVASNIGKVGVEGADKIEPVFRALATQFGGVSASLGKEVQIAAQAFDRLSGASGTALDDIRARYSALIAQNSTYITGLQQIQELSQKGLVGIGTVPRAEVEGLSQQLTQAINKAGTNAKIDLDVDGAALAGRIANALKAATATATPPVISVSASGTSLSAMQKDIEQSVKPKLQGELAINTIRWSAGQVAQPKQGTIPGNYRGGFFADIVASLPKFARGGTGRVRGPGTGTSDSIMARLSNGEYVMDALTTARFGPDFFSSLQKAARGGYSLSFMRNLQLPQFATGGFVGADMTSAFAGIATDFKSSLLDSSNRDVIDVNILSGSQKATIQAERQQAKSLVGILRQFEKGR